MNILTHDQTCQNTLKLLGDYWTLRIIDALEPGQRRFCELQRSVDNLNPVTLTDRLKKLEDARLVNRNEDLVDKVSVVYSLSPLGRESLPVIQAIDRFSSIAISHEPRTTEDCRQALLA